MKAKDFRKMARENLKGKWSKAVIITLAYYFFSLVIGFVMGFFEDVPSITFVLEIVYLLISIPLGYALVVQYLNLSNGKDVKAFDFVKWSITNFKKSWKVAFSMFRKLLLPIVVVIASVVIIVTSTISMVSNLPDQTLYDEPEQEYPEVIPFEPTPYDELHSNYDTIDSFTNIKYVGLIFIGSIGYIVGAIWLVVKSYYYPLVPYIMEEHSELSSKEIVNKSEEFMKKHRWKLFCLSFSFIGWIILSIFTLGLGLIFVLPYMQMALVAFYNERAGKLQENNPEEA